MKCFSNYFTFKGNINYLEITMSKNPLDHIFVFIFYLLFLTTELTFVFVSSRVK